MLRSDGGEPALKMDQVLVYIATNGSLCMSPADPPGPIALQVSLFFFASPFQSLQDLSSTRLCVICNASPLMERLACSSAFQGSLFVCR